MPALEDADLHAVLTKRITELQRERQGYWQKILGAIAKRTVQVASLCGLVSKCLTEFALRGACRARGRALKCDDVRQCSRRWPTYRPCRAEWALLVEMPLLLLH